MNSARSPLRTFELAVALAVIAATLLHLSLYAEKLAECSMHSDELGSVVSFTACGPWYAMTHYPIPRNHILFSTLASMLPGAGRLDPFSARALSYMVAVILGATILAVYFRRGRVFEAALMFALWGLNGELIHLSLQARGYGLLCLFAFLSSVFAVRFSGRKSPIDFALLGLCTVLGAYTVPTYAFFGGPLMLLLALRNRDFKALGLTVGTAVAIALLYLPVAHQLLAASAGYKAKYGEFYTGFASVAETVTTFLWPLPPWLALAFFAAVLLAPFAFALGCGGDHRTDRSDDSQALPLAAMQALNLAVLLFLGACLLMRTPPVRTTAFIALPVAFCVAEILGWLFRQTQRVAVRWALCALLLMGGTGIATREMSTFQFVPYEDWLGAWRFIATMFPRGTVVDCSHLADGLTYYMDQDRYRVKLEPGVAPGFAAGTVPIVAAPFIRGAFGFDLARTATSCIIVTVPGRVRDISIFFAVPAAKRVVRLTQSGSRDLPWPSDSAPSAIQCAGSLAVELDPASPSHSLNLLFDRAPDDLDLSAITFDDAGAVTVLGPRALRIGSVFTLPLKGAPVRFVMLKLHTQQASVRLKAIWAAPGEQDQ